MLIFEDYEVSNLNSISNALTTHECKYFPSICFQLYNFVWIRFGFLSDYDIVKQYFWNKLSDFSNLTKKVLPWCTSWQHYTAFITLCQVYFT